MLNRYGSAVLISSGVTLGLFFIMQLLVATGDQGLIDEKVGRVFGMIQEFIETPPEAGIVEPVAPPPPQDEPIIKRQQDKVFDPKAINVNPTSVPVEGPGIRNNGPGMYSDGDYLPIVKVQPPYPRRALRDGVEGFAIVEFTVTETGAVENPVVVDTEPKGYFETASKKAALKFKYKPKVLNGEPIRVSGVRNIFTFTLTQE